MELDVVQKCPNQVKPLQPTDKVLLPINIVNPTGTFDKGNNSAFLSLKEVQAGVKSGSVHGQEALDATLQQKTILVGELKEDGFHPHFF